MEESLKYLADSLKNLLPVNTDIRTYSPLTLAYIGDAVYDLMIRTLVVSEGNCKPQKLHGKTVRYVSAKSQAKIVGKILDSLDEEESTVYKRGYNAKPHTIAKNAGLEDYRKATGFECLLGYLYLQGEYERLFEVVTLSIDIIDNKR